MLRRVRQLSAWAGLVVGVACSDSTAPTAVGTYKLTRLNGETLPVRLVISIPEQTATVTGGLLVLNARSEWQAEVNVTVESAGVAVPNNQISSGTYRISRDTVYLRVSDGEVAPALLRGSRITVETSEGVFEFERR